MSVSFLQPSRSPWVGRMLSILRIVTAAMFIIHGTQKLFAWPPPAQPMHVEVMSQIGLAGILEAFGGLALLLGVFTRPIAFLLAGEMAVAYFQVHFPRSFFPVNNGGDNVVLFCFIFLYLTVAGAGTWSIDHMIASNRFDESSSR
jgi:putative oxidoreductase